MSSLKIDLLPELNSIEFKHIPRSRNSVADGLANLAIIEYDKHNNKSHIEIN